MPPISEHDASGTELAARIATQAMWPPAVPVIERSVLPRFGPQAQPAAAPNAGSADELSEPPSVPWATPVDRGSPASPRSTAGIATEPAGSARPAVAQLAAPAPPPAPAPPLPLPPTDGHPANAVAALARVTVIGPRGRVDVAVPVEVTVAELLPTILSLANHTGRDGHSGAGWVLQRLGERPLDTSMTVAALGIRDGDVLRLQPAHAPMPEAVFDDVLDAVATASRERGPAWSPADTRRFSLGLAVAALSFGGGLVAAAGPPWAPPALAAAAVATILTAAAAILSRAFGHSGAGMVLAVAALPYAALSGALGVAAPDSLAHLTAASAVVGCALVIVVAVLGALGVGGRAPQFTGVGAAAAVGLIAGLVCLYGGVAALAVAASVLGVTVAIMPLLPGLAFRIARVPLPPIPTGASDLRAQPARSSGRDAMARAILGDQYLTALVGASAAVAAACEIPLAIHGGWSLVLAVVASTVLLLRGRLFVRRAQRMCCLTVGAAGLTAAIAAVGYHQAGIRLMLLLPLAAAAVTAVAVRGDRTAFRTSPALGRAADILDGLLTLSLLPLCAAAIGLFGLVRSLLG
jgi:type VII secretion integral membrane protein EccD